MEVVDPFVEEFDHNVYEVANDADLLVLGVNHRQFRNIKFEVLSKIVKSAILLDTSNYYKR